jgi:3-isopropylmalate/(R)-2-methylmalate dehydratase small subunit
MTEAFPARVRSRAVVLRLENVDTDVITPIARVLQGRAAVVRFAFEPLRFGATGASLPTDPFADPARSGAEILIAGRNFGCGSSRETAAWAVRGLGFRIVVAPSYGDIFYSNCLKNGVLAVRLAAEAVQDLMDAADNLAEIEVDLARQRLTGGRQYPFEIGALQKEMLLSGLDEIGMMQARAAAQSAFDAPDDLVRPWVRRRTASPSDPPPEP